MYMYRLQFERSIEGLDPASFQGSALAAASSLDSICDFYAVTGLTPFLFSHDEHDVENPSERGTGLDAKWYDPEDGLHAVRQFSHVLKSRHINWQENWIKVPQVLRELSELDDLLQDAANNGVRFRLTVEWSG